MSKFQTRNINSELGVQLEIEYRNFDIKSYGCAICGTRDGYRENIEQHISEEHSTQKKMEALADEFGYEDNSRIDRFKRVMKTMGERDWAAELTTVHKQKPPVSEEPEGEPGLDAAPSVMTNGN